MNTQQVALDDYAECNRGTLHSIHVNSVTPENFAAFCHTLAALEVLSSTIAHQAVQKEPSERLARSIAVLDQNIREIAAHAGKLSVGRA